MSRVKVDYTTILYYLYLRINMSLRLWASTCDMIIVIAIEILNELVIFILRFWQTTQMEDEFNYIALAIHKRYHPKDVGIDLVSTSFDPYNDL